MNIPDSDLAALVDAARASRDRAHAPHSGYQVGAAVLDEAGTVTAGANVENASLGLSMCAERVAVGAAVSAGARRIVAAALVTSDGAAPCGACRQVLAEFMTPEAPLALAGPDGRFRILTLGELFPEPFG